MLLEDKVAIVTGAAAGIGKAVAIGLAEAGTRVIIADIRNDLASETAAGLRESGLSADSISVDVSDAGQVQRMMAAVVDSHGGVDILVNNAGVGQSSTLLETTEQEWDALMGVNMKGAFLCSRAAAAEMVRQGRGGRIINTVSTAGANARVGAAAYCASKAGLMQFTKALALELGPYGITVNAVGPGLTLTDSPVRNSPTEEYQLAFVGEVPMGRAATPEDIARTMTFLALPESEYINGQVILVDGGYSAGKLSVRG